MLAEDMKIAFYKDLSLYATMCPVRLEESAIIMIIIQMRNWKLRVALID